MNMLAITISLISFQNKFFKCLRNKLIFVAAVDSQQQHHHHGQRDRNPQHRKWVMQKRGVKRFRLPTFNTGNKERYSLVSIQIQQ